MTTYSKSSLKTFFQQGDIPTGTDYANFIDSQVNIVETDLQSMGGPLQATELIASRVSAGNANFTGTVSAVSLNAFNLTVSNIINAASASYQDMTITNSLSVVGQTSATNINISGELIRTVTNYVAAGTAQATATVISAGLATLTGASDGQTTGYRLMANKTGLVQQIFNQNTVSANLWPCTGGQINVLASNAAFGMTASTMYTVFHTKASGYAVK